MQRNCDHVVFSIKKERNEERIEEEREGVRKEKKKT